MSLRIGVASDLHFEFHRDGGTTLADYLAKACQCDVLVVAGDLAVGRQTTVALGLLAERFQHVVYVPGNHEHYAASRGVLSAAIAEAVAAHPNVHHLDKSSVTIEGRRFLGGTMWFRKPSQLSAERYARLKGCMTDFSLIPDFESWVYEENQATIEYLLKEAGPDDVVVTHHLPAIQSVHPKYAGDALNVFFLCDVGNVVDDNKPALWVHGHTHESMDYTRGKTRVVCNPFGYAAREENPSFTFRKVVVL